MTIGTTQDERSGDASTKPYRTDLGTKRLSSIAAGAAAIQVTNKFVTPGDLVVKKVVELPDNRPVSDSPFKDTQFTSTMKFTDTNDAELTKVFDYQVYAVAESGAERMAPGDGTSGTVASGGTVSLRHNQTVHVKGLPVGTKFTVTETAADGFTTKATSDNVTGAADADGNMAISGSIAGKDDVSETFTNTPERSLKIHEVDEDNNDLTGAKFKLTKTNPVENQAWTQEREAAAHDTDASATFDGLVSGATYTIEEIYMPKGYSKMVPDRTPVINTEGTATITGSDGTTTGAVTVGDDGNLTVTIQNTKLTDLPQTGGIGNYPLFAVGFVVMAGAALLVSSARRQRT